MTRYLTPEEKEKEVAHMRVTNLLDPGILPLLEQFNAIPGLATVQSCIGHWKTCQVTGDRYLEPACLWIRLDEPMMQAFYREAFRLGDVPGVDHVGLLFQNYGDEIVDVRCSPAGTERSWCTFTSIAHFFRDLANGLDTQ